MFFAKFIPIRRYVAPEEVFIVANRLNLGFCREYQEEVADWDECVKQVV